jgi:hypothetical protein
MAEKEQFFHDFANKMKRFDCGREVTINRFLYKLLDKESTKF